VVTDLARLDGPATAAVTDQLVAVYRAAMSAPPFFETEVETGWFAEELAGEITEPGFRCWAARDGDRLVGFAYGLPTPEIPADGWYGLVRDAVGEGASEWLEGQFAVVWIAVHPEWRGRGLGRRLLEHLLGEADAERAWLITHDLDTPARALYRSLGFRELGHGPLGWHDANRLVLGAQLGAARTTRRRRAEPDPPAQG
jgi:ribosomal protein S18 acetylase RimI-like enzyme